MPAWASHRMSSACGVDAVTSRNDFRSASDGFHVDASPTFMSVASLRMNAAMSWRFTESMPRNVRVPSDSAQPVVMPADAAHLMSSACGVDAVTSRNATVSAYADGPARPAASVAIAARPAARRLVNILVFLSMGSPGRVPLETPHAGSCLNDTARTRGSSIAVRKGLCRPSSRTWLQCSGWVCCATGPLFIE